MQMISPQGNYFRTTIKFSRHDLREKSMFLGDFLQFFVQVMCNKVNCCSKIIMLRRNHLHICNGQGMRNLTIPILPIQKKVMCMRDTNFEKKISKKTIFFQKNKGKER